MVLNLLVFIIIFFLENNDSAPCSILRNIFWNNLSTKINKTLKDFLNPKFRKFIDLTDTDLIIFCNSSCTNGIKRNAINNWKSHLLSGNPIFLNGERNQLIAHTISSCNVVKSIKLTLWITVNIKVEVLIPSSKAFLDKL